ncbi:MAG: VCBS domain-containing protein, partial [Sphingomicrobium sp.]
MATQTTGGGSTTSLSNTPQANGDIYYKSEADLGVYCFDVMSNDLGGNAKILWSLDDSATDAAGALDLIQSDTSATAVTTTDTSAAGAKIWIESGKVRYDANSLPLAMKNAIDALGYNGTLSDSFTYAIRMANGTLAWTTVTVVFKGVNDNVVISASSTATGCITEDSGNYQAAGSIGFGDVDLSDTHTVNSAANGSGYLGTFSAVLGNDSTGDGSGQVDWTFDVDNSAIQYLATNETKVQEYTVTIDDGHGGSTTQTVSVTLKGVNDAVVIVPGGIVAGAVVEDGGDYEETGSFGFSDVDLTDTHSVSVTPAGSGYLGTLSASVSNDSTGDGAGQVDWTFNVDNDFLQSLGEDEVVTQTYSVTVNDGHGGSVSQTVTITLTGVNGLATIAGDDSGDVVEDTTLTATGTLTIDD